MSFICQYCSKSYTTSGSKNRHEKVCNTKEVLEKKDDVVVNLITNLTKRINSMEKEMKKIKQENQELKSRILQLMSNLIIDNGTNKTMKHVYFIFQEGDDFVCKIGKSKESCNRIKQLQTGNPNRLYVYKIINGYTEEESELHKRFAEFRITGTEWFHISKEDVDLAVTDYEEIIIENFKETEIINETIKETSITKIIQEK